MDMFKNFTRHFALLFFISFIIFPASAQKVQEPGTTDPSWSVPYPPFRIAGNLYYVGTYELACYFIATPQGNILINTGLSASALQIKKNVETLGFALADTKILLTTQAHYDHLGAMAAIKEMTGAQLMVDEKDAEVLKSGGSTDYALGDLGISFQPVIADRLLQDGDTISLGDMQLVMLHHPGHTKGSCSFLFSVKDDQDNYRVLVANMPSIVTKKPFHSMTAYAGIAKDYAYTLKAMKNISFDIWLASHASQFNLHEKHQPGDKYNPAAFIDRQGYDAGIDELQKEFDEKMKKDALQ